MEVGKNEQNSEGVQLWLAAEFASLVTPQNVIIAAKCNINAKCNKNRRKM